MGIYHEIKEKINDKQYTTEELIRFIYLYTCKKYSFDPRFEIALKGHKKELLESLFDYHPNIKKDENNKDIICLSYCNNILGPLIEKITKAKVSYYGSGFGHRYITVPFFNEEIILDATENDLARVKMNMSTKGFGPEPFNYNKEFEEKLRNVDYKISYIEDHYYDETLVNKYTPSNLSELVDVINMTLRNNNIRHYSDAMGAIAEIFDLYFDNFRNIYLSHATFTDFSNYLGIYYLDGNYYKLYKDGTYKFKQISISEFLYISENFKSYDLEEVLEPDIKP